MAPTLKMTCAITGMRASSLDDLDIASRHLNTQDDKNKFHLTDFVWPDPRSTRGSLEPQRDLAWLLPKSHRSEVGQARS